MVFIRVLATMILVGCLVYAFSYDPNFPDENGVLRNCDKVVCK